MGGLHQDLQGSKAVQKPWLDPSQGNVNCHPTTLNGAHIFFPSQGLSGVNLFPNGDEGMLLYAADTWDNEDTHLFNAAPAAAISPMKVGHSHHFKD